MSTVRVPAEKYQVTRGGRMKAYELPWKQVLPPKSYVIVRVDGKAFHSYTRGMQRPFDEDLMCNMNQAAVVLCQQVQGARFAYVQSDEISLLLTDFGLHQEQWFGGSVQKIASVAASIATVGFNQATLNMFGDFNDHWAQFDARVFTVPSREEAINYFLWRQADCLVNAISMIAESHFPSKDLLYANMARRAMMLSQAGISVESFPEGARRGRVVTKVSVPGEVTYTHKRTGETSTEAVVRHVWQPAVAPWFDWDQAGFLEEHVPRREDGDDEV